MVYAQLSYKAKRVELVSNTGGCDRRRSLSPSKVGFVGPHGLTQRLKRFRFPAHHTAPPMCNEARSPTIGGGELSRLGRFTGSYLWYLPVADRSGASFPTRCATSQRRLYKERATSCLPHSKDRARQRGRANSASGRVGSAHTHRVYKFEGVAQGVRKG